MTNVYRERIEHRIAFWNERAKKLTLLCAETRDKLRLYETMRDSAIEEVAKWEKLNEEENNPRN